MILFFISEGVVNPVHKEGKKSQEDKPFLSTQHLLKVEMIPLLNVFSISFIGHTSRIYRKKIQSISTLPINCSIQSVDINSTINNMIIAIE